MHVPCNWIPIRSKREDFKNEKNWIFYRAIIKIYLDVCLVLAGEGAEHHIMIISEAINRLQEAGVPALSAH